jgi:tetratricopeptide (TPR) repeat protein
MYEQLSPEDAAHVDAICDRFERAWKEAKAGGPIPNLASYIGHNNGGAQEVLLRELTALDFAYRERFSIQAVDDGAYKESNTLTGHPNVPAGPASAWPIIPGLELVELLGSGGMGVVFRARQATLDREVAVKLLRDGQHADFGHRERFLQEARAVARLHHPNLVQLYEFGELPALNGATSQPYLVLEYVSGGSLADRVRGSALPPREAAQLVETLAGAIHYAHQQGIIHRDLKPANVLLSHQSPKVTDFGLAKFLQGSDLTRSGHVIGTPSYIAPEQASGKSAPITPAVDVYGLGAILYEALTGRPPFAAETIDATLSLVRQEDPVPPRRLQPTVTRDLETICLKCLRKEPGRRYATALDLADDLGRFQEGKPVRARPVGVTEGAIRWCRRKPAVAGLLAALMLVFVCGCAGVLWQWQRANRHATLAEQERDMALQETARATHHLQTVSETVDRLNQIGRDLLRRPGMYRTGQAVLEQALAFYREMLPEDLNDPKVRQEAAKLYHQVADIHDHLGQTEQAAEAFGQRTKLLASLLEENQDNKDLRLALADAHRWHGNELRTVGKMQEAREAYDQATRLHEDLLRDSPDEPRYRVALANTLLNTTNLLSQRAQQEELESLYRRVLELEREAVRAMPDRLEFRTELALTLEAQGFFFLNTGRVHQAEAAVREALELHQRLLAQGHAHGPIQRYTARSFASLARVLAAAGRTQEAEQAYQQAVTLLEPLVGELPESMLCRGDLAQTLTNLANLFKETLRRQGAADTYRRVIQHCEILRTGFPENSQYLRLLVDSYLELVELLWQLGRQSEAAEPYRKLLEIDSEDAGINNNRAWFLVTTPEPRLRDPSLAVRLAQKAVSAKPKSGNCRNTLGVALYRRGDDKAAIAELEEAMRLRAGGDSSDWFILALAHWRLGNRDEARKWLALAVQWMDKHKPNDADLRRFRAEAEAVVSDSIKRPSPP